MTLLSVRALGKAYGSRRVLEGLELGLNRGEKLGLIGPNGAGKTTLLRILMGLVRPSSGSVEWETRSAGQVGYFGGEQTVPPQVRSDRWARAVSPGSSEPVEARPIKTLSRGSRQMLGLRTILSRTGMSAVLLDEPWEGLDPDGARWLSSRVRELAMSGAACMLSSHRLHDLAGLCERYAFLIDGRLVIRSAEAVASRSVVTGDDLLAAFDKFREAQ